MSRLDELREVAVRAKEREKKAADKYRTRMAQTREAVKAYEAAQIPGEPMSLGSVVRFVKMFNGTTEYIFAAVKSPTGRWSVTGRGGMTEVTWATLIEFVKRDEKNPTAALDTLYRFIAAEKIV